MNRSIGRILKDQAKSRGMTQSDVAKKAKVSLPTVKRWFIGRGLTLEHLETLLNILSFSFSELAAFVSSEQSHDFEFSLEQERAMARDPSLYAYFDKLLKGLSPSQIERTCQLGERRTAVQLRSLEKLGLLERHPKGKVKLLVQGQPRWKANGPLAKTLKWRAVEDFLDESRLNTVRLGMHEINSEDYKRLEIMLIEIQSFARIAESRSRALPDSPLSIGLLVGLAPFRWKLMEGGASHSRALAQKQS